MRHPLSTLIARFAALAIATAFILISVSYANAAPPASKEAFDKAYLETGDTPEGALKLWFDGVFLYGSDDSKTHKLGKYIIEKTTKELHKKRDWEKASSVGTFVDRMKSAKHIFRSYAKGSTPENNYKMDLATYELNIIDSSEDPYAKGYAIRLQSGGADNPRPVFLRKNKKTNLWEITRFSNVYLGVKKVVIED